MTQTLASQWPVLQGTALLSAVAAVLQYTKKYPNWDSPDPPLSLQQLPRGLTACGNTDDCSWFFAPDFPSQWSNSRWLYEFIWSPVWGWHGGTALQLSLSTVTSSPRSRGHNPSPLILHCAQHAMPLCRQPARLQLLQGHSSPVQLCLSLSCWRGEVLR